jgi:hypothetical protein
MVKKRFGGDENDELGRVRRDCSGGRRGGLRRAKLNFGIQFVDIVIGVSLLSCSMLVFE